MTRTRRPGLTVTGVLRETLGSHQSSGGERDTLDEYSRPGTERVSVEMRLTGRNTDSLKSVILCKRLKPVYLYEYQIFVKLDLLADH